MEVDVKIIETQIEQAQHNEQQQQTLKQYVAELVEEIHPSIQLPETNTEASIYGFLVQYIELVPQHFQILFDGAGQSDEHQTLQQWIWPVMYLCQRYFSDDEKSNNSKNTVRQHSESNNTQCADQNRINLVNLIDTAYLAHRLFEELDELLAQRLQHRLLPLDLTTTNVIVHDIIGDPLASQLDELVSISIDGLKQMEAELPHLARKTITRQKPDWRHALALSAPLSQPLPA